MMSKVKQYGIKIDGKWFSGFDKNSRIKLTDNKNDAWGDELGFAEAQAALLNRNIVVTEQEKDDGNN